MAQGHLLLKREALQGILDALLDGGILLQVERSSLLPLAPVGPSAKSSKAGKSSLFIGRFWLVNR